MFERRFLIIAFMAIMSAGAVAQAQQAWQHYSNERYGFAIDYPAQFRSDPPPANGDGLHFKATDGAEFTASAMLNTSDDGGPQSLAQYEASLRQDGNDYAHVSYRAVSGDTLVLSGLRGNRVFYEKHILSANGELANSFVITYPASRKSTYDAVAARMAQSFRPGTLGSDSN